MFISRVEMPGVLLTKRASKRAIKGSALNCQKSNSERLEKKSNEFDIQGTSMLWMHADFEIFQGFAVAT